MSYKQTVGPEQDQQERINYMSAEDKEAQEDELLALASIYAEDEFQRAVYAQGGQIRICLELPPNFRIFVNGMGDENHQKGTTEVCVLPPVLLTFELPENYPSTSAPAFVLSCKWLTPVQLTTLCKQLDSLWEENKGCVVLFAWIQFLKEETLQYLNISSPYELSVCSVTKYSHKSPNTAGKELCENTDAASSEPLDGRAMQDVESLDSLIRDILDFDQTQQLRRFHSKPYLCSVCFCEKLGRECTQFKACQHVYCNACLKGYFEIQIKEGQVHLLSCPEPKCPSVAIPAQVKELVGEQLFSRYDRLLLQSSLDSMSDVVYCPRQNCRTPVMKEPGGTMGICSNCRYAFCALCEMTYHGVSPCKPPEDLQELEANGSNGTTENSNEAETLEEEYLEYASIESHKHRSYKTWMEKASRQYVKMNSKKCPHCGIPIEKDGGCNRMYCAKCLKFFCWHCCYALSIGDLRNHSRDSPSCSTR